MNITRTKTNSRRSAAATIATSLLLCTGAFAGDGTPSISNTTTRKDINSAARDVTLSGGDAEISKAKEDLRKRLLAVEQEVPNAVGPLKALRDYASLAEKRTWHQGWNPVTRTLSKEPLAMTGMVWSAAIEQSMKEQNGVLIPEMAEPVYLDRSIIVESGSRIIVHPKTEIRMIIGDTEHCLVRNRHIVSGQNGPVDLCKGADRDILIEGGIWSDQKNNGAGPQGFRKGRDGLMLGSQGCFVLSNVEKVTVRNVTLRDYSSFGIQIGNARNFLVEGVCLDGTKDGVHVDGPAQLGIIRNINGPLAGDDVVALNAWDWGTSSLTFGTISDILVQDTDVKKGSCAIRILPGIKIFPDGSTLACEVSRCIFSHIRNCHSFKIYDQPNIRCVKEDYSADIGFVSDLFFEDIHVQPLNLTTHNDKSKSGVFELCANASGLYLDNIYLDYVPGTPFPEYLLTVGPKSRIARIPFAASGTQEIFNPKASPVAKHIVIRNVFTRPEGDAGEYQRHKNPEALVHCTSIPGGGQGRIVGDVTGKQKLQ